MSLPKNPLPTLADEILAALPSLMAVHPRGPSLAQIAKELGATLGSIRRAAVQINKDARADLMRRVDSREYFLVPFRYRMKVGLRYCANCDETFKPRPKSDHRRCCCRACSISWSWGRPGTRERRSAGISISKQTPKAMAALAEHNKRRWSRPGEREKLAEQNRREWSDPVKGKLRAQSIAAINGSPEMRQFYSDLRKEWWKDPVMRRKMNDAAKASQGVQAYREKLSRLVKERWRDPVWRAKWIKSSARNAAKATAAIKGKRQSPEQVEKRTASTRLTKQLRAEMISA